jgi:hypothetical protein
LFGLNQATTANNQSEPSGYTMNKKLATAVFALAAMFGHDAFAQDPSTKTYSVQIQFGGEQAKWNDLGVWTLDSPKKNNLVKIDAKSSDDGKTLQGTATFAGEGPVGLKAELGKEKKYSVQIQFGGEQAKWNDLGVWTLDSPKKNNLVKIDAKSSDDGKTLQGTATFEGEGPVGFKATLGKGQDGYEGLAGSYKEKSGGEMLIRRADDEKKEAGPWRFVLKGAGDWACDEGLESQGEGKPTIYFIMFAEGSFKGERYNIVRGKDGKVTELQLVGGSKAIWVRQ